MNKKNVVSIRLDDEELDYLNTIAKLLDVTPAKYIRLLIDSSMVKYRIESEVNKDEYP